jgi:hypothetical protein
LATIAKASVIGPDPEPPGNVPAVEELHVIGYDGKG